VWLADGANANTEDPEHRGIAGAKDRTSLRESRSGRQRVTSITAGKAIANVELDANGVRLVASITVEAVRELGLAEGSNVTAVIKASDVLVATSD